MARTQVPPDAQPVVAAAGGRRQQPYQQKDKGSDGKEEDKDVPGGSYPIVTNGTQGNRTDVPARCYYCPKGGKGDKGDVGRMGPRGPHGLKGDKGDQGEFCSSNWYVVLALFLLLYGVTNAPSPCRPSRQVLLWP